MVVASSSVGLGSELLCGAGLSGATAASNNTKGFAAKDETGVFPVVTVIPLLSNWGWWAGGNHHFYQPQMNCQFISSDPDSFGWGKETLRRSWGLCLLMQHLRAFTWGDGHPPWCCRSSWSSSSLCPRAPTAPRCPSVLRAFAQPAGAWVVRVQQSKPPTLCLLLV